MGNRISDAIALAKVRWAQYHPFDIPDETWEQLFAQYPAGIVLQAITLTKDTNDRRPEKRYARFEQMLARLSAPTYPQF